MFRKFLLSLCILSMVGCASITSEDVLQNAHHREKLSIPLSLEQAEALTAEIMHICYPNIDFALVPGAPGALELYKIEKEKGSHTQFLMGNITYGGILTIDLRKNTTSTDIELIGKDNGWNRHFYTVTSMLKKLKTNECEA